MSGGQLVRILLIEDDSDIQAIAKIALEGIGGFIVEICSTGAEAIQKAPLFSPDMVLLDVMMPGMDGPTTLRALRGIESLASTPAVFLTAKVHPKDVAHYRELGAVDVLRKPFDPMTLSETLRNIWAARS